ncbi:2-(1,2-epoxy-1,2-dihydrophenyl)acetyl-CoA isomerase [Anaerolineae bacterium]|nr:2-(1,2-epoxy-1,2-dihydrophenyl)acetyl-CoA isomerase [Anaerolineae bacterium]
MAYDFKYEVAEGIATVIFSRPDKLNAITFEIYAQFRDLLEALRYDDAVKVLVLTGEGRAFSSGGDVYEIIGELFKRDVKGLLDFTRMTGAVVRNMRLLDKPIIAALNGTTAGAGAVIALAADFRIMADSAKFHFLFTKVGLTGADMGAAYLLPRIVGAGRAMEILMFGDPVDAATAERIGLANRTVAREALMPTVYDWAKRLARGPSLALSMTKHMVNNEANMDLIAAIEQEAQAQALMLQSQDHREFFEAFNEKREPEFKGR